jgi:phosphatidate cytidylyltransferase
MSPLAQRVVTAIPLLTGLLLLLFVAPPWAVIWVTGAVVVIGAWEWSAFLGWRLPLARGIYAAGMALALALFSWLVPAVVELEIVLWISLLWWAIAFLWILRYPTAIPPPMAAVSGALVLIPCWLAMVAILSVPGRGAALALLALSVVIAADIGAYFAGHRFGRVKLAPQVSPGKTWEGLFGGVLLAALTAGAGGLALGLSPRVMVPLGLGVATLSVVGDLTESMFKRSVGAKDSGHLIPGHGGVLDRIDGITAAMPLFALALSWLGLSTG